MTDQTIATAPQNIDLTNCFISPDGGKTKTTLSEIQQSANAATAKVVDLEDKLEEMPDTSTFLTRSNINKANGVLGTDSSNNINVPVNSNNSASTTITFGLDLTTGAKLSTYSQTVMQYNIGASTRPYQEVMLATTTTDAWKRVWGSGIYPANLNDTSLGKTDRPFKDLFVANAPTVTSDINTKNVITDNISTSDYAKLLDAVYSVSASLYTLKIVVADKGEAEARIHSGFIAQELEKAMIEQGLDPSKFAFWCKSPMYDEIVDEEGFFASKPKLDSDGNQVYQQSLRYEELFVLLIEAIKVKFEARLAALEAKQA